MPATGTKVIHQVPTGSITQDPSSNNEPLIQFSGVFSDILPRQSLSARSVTLLQPPYRILSHPIRLSSDSYARNEFFFAFSLVLSQTTDPTAYAVIVSKLAALFTNLETTSFFLSRDRSPPNTGRVFALCEILLEDLNNYCECMIPLDASNTLNLKLFPTYQAPPMLSPQDVPLATARLDALTDSNWDITMLDILPLIDGVNSIRKIAQRADAEYKLVRKAITHLLYYGCVILLDIFSFGASYAPTAEFGIFVSDRDMQEEGRLYAMVPRPGDGTGTLQGAIDGTQLVEMYASLRQGQSLRSWCLEHPALVAGIDIRRFITFGVIKGFLYRVHKYAIAMSLSATTNGVTERNQPGKAEVDMDLEKFLDGTYCFDEICTELQISEMELLRKLKRWGDVQIIQR
jgi:hypothetical protein